MVMPEENILHFNGRWRSYQLRILDSLEFHLRDKKLHVVAAPGAGKTTLGIEVISRLHRPALILCPTNTIKNQWRERICSAFLQETDYGEDAVIVSRFDDDGRYVRVTPRESVKNIIVSLITEMFCAGDMTVLVGTQALLGEGWDAPAINSLILSSTVSSYMLSNQMRGRAIRIDKNNLDKVSNIWHLATIDFPDEKDFPMLGTITDSDLDAYRLYTYDLQQLATRFKGFEAPAYYGKHEIVSGIERVLDAPSTDPMYPKAGLKEKVARVRDVTKQLAADREQTRRWWKDALYLGYGNDWPMGLTTGVEAPKMSAMSLMFKGYKYIVACALPAALLAYVTLLRVVPALPLTLVALVLIAAFLGFIGMKYLKTGTVEGVMKQMAITILETMSAQGLIKSSVKNVGLHVAEHEGMLFVSCTHLPVEENNLFIQSLQELLDSVENPRYLLVRHSTFLGKVRQTDYFSIPALLSSNRQGVDTFKRLWQKYIGDCEVVYTRTLEGRKMLLKARKEASSALKRDKSKRLSKWL